AEQFQRRPAHPHRRADCSAPHGGARMNALTLGLTVWLIAAEPPAHSDSQDFVFLAEARPVLVRVQVRIDVRSLPAAYDDFMKHLSAHLDINGDGVLSKDEAERVPGPSQFLGGGFAALVDASGAPKWDKLDADKDGKVRLAELSAHYRQNGF